MAKKSVIGSYFETKEKALKAAKNMRNAGYSNVKVKKTTKFGKAFPWALWQSPK